MYFTNKIEKTYKSDGNLTGNEKLQVVITEFLNPIAAQAFYYFCWKKEFPKRAGQANKYGWLIFGLWIIIAIVMIVAVLQPKH